MKKQVTIITLLLLLANSNNYAGGFSKETFNVVDDFDRWVEIYLEDLHSFFPDLDDKLDFMDISYPKDIAAQTGKPAGPVEGLGMTPSQVGRNKPSSIIPGIEGLYVVGDTTGKTAHGIGTQLACDSGLKCADAILGLLDMSKI